MPPVLADPQNWVAYTGERFELQLSAEAGDLGEHTFSLIGSVVGDMAIDSASGLFSWTPRRGNEGYSYAVCVQVTTSSGLTDAVVFYVAVRRRITAQPVGPSFGPALFSGGSEGRPLRRPRRW